MANPTIQSFGKYQILERIATGGMAEIYKARLEGIGGFQRTFAIKRILPNLSQNSEYIGMLVDEAKVAGLLSHANIVQILDLGQVDGIWYIAMEYVEGRDLGAILRRAQRKGLCLPVPHTVFITIELLKGLEYAHQRQVMKGGRAVALNIIHRDVSPPNVLLSFQGEVKLTDFGIARASLKAMETVSGVVKGRFDYMSPEQARGARDLDQRSDLFTVGVLLYEMLTGKHPFRTDNELDTITRVKSGRYVPVSQRNAEVPFTLETIVDTALAVDRDDRYVSATAFKEALDQFFHDAGFIFTHATLASYVRGLFPEADPRSGRSTEFDSEQGTDRHLDGPTNPHTRPEGMRRPEALRPPLDQRSPTGGRLPDPLPRPSLGDLLDDQDQETLIRKMPEGWDLDAALGAEASGPVHRQSIGFDEKQPLVPTDGGTNTASGRRTTTGARRRRRKRSSAIPWVLSVAALFTGLTVGATGTAVVALIAGFRFAGTDPTLTDPQIQVVAPPGTQIRIDGDVVGKRTEVSPGTPHRVEVTLQGQLPWSDEIVLNRGEQRVIIIGPR